MPPSMKKKSSTSYDKVSPDARDSVRNTKFENAGKLTPAQRAAKSSPAPFFMPPKLPFTNLNEHLKQAEPIKKILGGKGRGKTGPKPRPSLPVVAKKTVKSSGPRKTVTTRKAAQAVSRRLLPSPPMQKPMPAKKSTSAAGRGRAR